MSTPSDVFDPASELATLLASYAPSAGSFDELLGADGTIRPPWQPVLDSFARMTSDERKETREMAERLIRQNGVTFLATDEKGSHVRPWHLDMLPMVISSSEWQTLEAGLIQRARLLNRLLVDLYGPQRVLADRVLPPSIVFGNRQFLRPCVGINAKNDSHLLFAAFDVARSPDGRWWVLSDRSEAPSGAGFALENRVVTSRCLPELFANQNVRRQASFFRAFSDQFLSQSNRDDPVAVYLTRGPAKRTYFEQAYLARYLGYNVVEGSDLTVRDDRVFVKTVAGLKPVDLILRTIRSEMCDPLELRTDSLIGIPGLLQAARSGSVTIANSLGSGLVESDAFLSFLGNLSRYYFSEDLLLPSVATWWCGQEQERDYVLENLDRLIIRRISTTRSLLLAGRDGQVESDESTLDRETLAAKIRQEGHDFIGQEPLNASSSPVVGRDDAIQAAQVVVRFYVAATANGYQVMPGGLTRVVRDSSRSYAESELSKDTWVLSDEPVDSFSLLAERQREGRLRRSGRDLPSRAADNLFWLGRYAERGEAAVRLLRSLVIRLEGEVGDTRRPVSLDRIVALLVASKHMPARRGRRVSQLGRAAVQTELWSILF
ncbi:MAG: circularly permuted type 2 ATP-grasp protein, partial [Gammaproteobacteria bacterium]